MSGVRRLIARVKSNDPNLLTVEEENNNFGNEKDLLELFGAMAEKNTFVSQLAVRSCNFSKPLNIMAVAEMLRKNTTLKELHLFSDKLGSGDFFLIFGRALRDNPNSKLEKLKFASPNSIEDDRVFVGIADIICFSQSLKELDLSHNQLGGPSIAAVARALKKSPMLRSLNLDYTIPENKARNDAQGVRKGFEALAEALRANPMLEELRLSGNFIFSDSIFTLFAGSSYLNNNLKRLSLNYNYPIDEKGIQILFDFIRSSSLQEIDLGYTSIGFDGALANAFPRREDHDGHYSLEVLSLNSNFIENDGAFGLANILPCFLSSLRILTLVENQIGDEGAKAIVDAITSNSNNENTTSNSIALQTLMLTENQLTNEGFVHILNALISTQINCLCISFQGELDTTLTRFLHTNDSLQVLCLRGSKDFGDAGCDLIAAALSRDDPESSSSPLRSLDLTDTGIQKKGACVIANALRNNDKLEALLLNSNKLEDEGCRSLAAALAFDNSCLRYLSLAFCAIGQGGINSLVAAARTNFSLHQIDLQLNNDSSEADFQTLHLNRDRPLQAEIAKTTLRGKGFPRNFMPSIHAPASYHAEAIGRLNEWQDFSVLYNYVCAAPFMFESQQSGGKHY